jgi:hypothetical protein
VCGARGDPGDPLNDAEINEKFERLASPHLTSDRLAALRKACWNAAGLADMRELVALLAMPPDTWSD